MAEDAVHIERIERIRLLMLILKISDWLVDVVLLQQSHSVVGWTLLSPGTQVHFGNSRGLTRENVVTEILSINILICPSAHYLLHIGWSPECERLHLLNVVPVITGDPGQAALSDLKIAESE